MGYMSVKDENFPRAQGVFSGVRKEGHGNPESSHAAQSLLGDGSSCEDSGLKRGLALAVSSLPHRFFRLVGFVVSTGETFKGLGNSPVASIII